MGTSDFGANVNEVKSEAGVNDERKPVNGIEEDHRKDEALGVLKVILLLYKEWKKKARMVP